ncbi:MAG: glycoside hydrolase family 15 protein [Actinomycetota bacterium]|nr:glycoside hydrolase family 15 protein [Actinomycetota bacterium]
MSAHLEDYAVLGDTETAALVSLEGSIDWLCLPRFDAAACFASLLGGPHRGRWLLAPAERQPTIRRTYRDGTLVLETVHEGPAGSVRVTDVMPPRGAEPDLCRVVEGLTGEMPMRMELSARFDYGSVLPWVDHLDDGVLVVGGPDSLRLTTDVNLHTVDQTTIADFTVRAGDKVGFTLTWYPSHVTPGQGLDPFVAVDETETWWREWSDQCRYTGEWEEPVRRSLITLKALTHAPTGGIVAAATTSLPERIGGVRNWDYRFCWLRDAALTLDALMLGGYLDEAAAWRDWLLRTVAGDPSQLQIMYGAAGERRLTELELPWLEGYEGSRPVRIGNAAVEQRQIDVYGEVISTVYDARVAGLPFHERAWAMEQQLLEWLETGWREQDYGIWEVRGEPRHFTHSKVMAWVAMDRAVKSVVELGLSGPSDRWRRVRDEIHAEVCHQGYDAEVGSFVQHYGGKGVDASLLLIPLVGFLPADDPRVKGTVAEVERRLLIDGLVLRYLSDSSLDGLPPGEGAFLACTFWYADNLALQGRLEEAREVFERLLALRNDLGLLAEQYDPVAGRLLGNFPQAFSHVCLVNTAVRLDRAAEGVRGLAPLVREAV